MTDKSNHINNFYNNPNNYISSAAYQNKLKNELILTDKDGKRWKEIISTVGTYYVNEETGETQYDRPECENCEDSGRVDSTPVTAQQKPYLEYTENAIPNSSWLERVFTSGEKCYFNTETNELSWVAPHIDEGASTLGKAVDAEPISNTDWLLVRSDNNQIFYFNSKTQTSVWEKPTELEHNPLFQSTYDKFVGGVENNNEKEKRANPCDIIDDEIKDTTEINFEAKKFKLSDDEQDSLSSDENEESDDDTARIQSIIDIKLKGGDNKDEPEISAITKQMLLLPYDEKVAIFKELLDEYNVSVFGTWEKECERMKDDPRLEILSLKDRKIHYNEFLRHRATSEASTTRKEREEKKKKFFEFLQKVVKDPRMKYLEFSSKYSSSPEFNIFTRTKERETFFNEYLDTYVRSSICVDPKQIKINYCKMLDELNLDVDLADWKSVKPSIKKDLRYLNVDSSKQRKSWFKDYLKEYKILNKFKNKTKEEIALMSLKQREKDVQRERNQIDKSRQKTLGHFEYKNSIDQLKVLLNHYVQTCLFSYETVIKIFQEKALAKIDSIQKYVKEITLRKIVEEHLKKILTKQIQLLHYTLDELIDVGTINLSMNLNEVCNIIQRARNITIDIPDQTLQREFELYINRKEQKFTEQFKSLLNETKLIDLIFERKNIRSISNKDIVEEITEYLKKDRRYQQLAYNTILRDKILDDQIEYKRSSCINVSMDDEDAESD